MPRDHSDLTLHYPFGVLYKEPLGYIEGGGIEEQRNYSSLLPQFTCTWVCIPLSLWSTLCSSQAYLCFVRLLSIDGGLRWWSPRWRTRFLWFIDVLTEVVTIVISDFINRNIFSYLIMCNWIWILNPWICLIVYTLMNIYARVVLTHYI